MQSYDRYETRYEQTAGIHHFETLDGTPVHAVSAGSWDKLRQLLDESLPLTGIVLGPELITLDLPVKDAQQQITEARARIETIIGLSMLHPAATFLIGAPDQSFGSTRNSLAAISNGRILGNIDKLGPPSAEEASVFSRGPQRAQFNTAPGFAALICSDAIEAATNGCWINGEAGHGPALTEAKTLLISSAWAVPQGKEQTATATDRQQHFRENFERTVSGLFTVYPNLQEIIVADRPLEANGMLSYTGQFRRLAIHESARSASGF